MKSIFPGEKAIMYIMTISSSQWVMLMSNLGRYLEWSFFKNNKQIVLEY